MRAWCKVGAKCGTWVPRTSPFEILSSHKEPLQFWDPYQAERTTRMLLVRWTFVVMFENRADTLQVR
jgi:hypothetical protein